MKKSIYIYTDGQLNQKDRTLQFTTYENEKKDIPIELISDIYIMSNMTLNTTMLNLISQYGIILHFFNYYHFYTGSFYPKENLVSGELLVKQVETYTNAYFLPNGLLPAQQIIFIEICDIITVEVKICNLP